MSDPEQKHTQPTVLQTLTNTATADANEFNGLNAYEGLAVSTASDYKALEPAIFKFLKENLALAAHLPKPPTLGEYAFLLTRKATLVTELFNDTWNSASLNYAANAEVYAFLAELVEAGTVEPDADVVKAAGQALLTSSNVLARSLQYYRHIVKKQAAKGSEKPGAARAGPGALRGGCQAGGHCARD